MLIYSLCALGAIGLCGVMLIMLTGPGRNDEAAGLGITPKDLIDYAGKVVAYDCVTNETLGAYDDCDSLADHLSWFYPERQAHLVRLPLKAGGPIQLLGHFGPCVINSERTGA